MADHAAAFLLALLRKLPLYDRAIRADGWCQPGALSGRCRVRLHNDRPDRAGRIGLSLAGRLHPSGFRVVAYDPYADGRLAETRLVLDLLALEELLAQASAISLHVPVTQETRHLVDRRFLNALRPGTVLVDASRGGLIDEAALADALSSGQLAAAALDVFDPEPLDPRIATEKLGPTSS